MRSGTTDLEFFDELYSMWPTQRDKANTKLAFDWVLKKFDYSPTELLQAATLQITLQPNIKLNLGQWLRDERFIEFIRLIKSSGGFELAQANLRDLKEVSLEIIELWNQVAKGWWAKVEDVDSKVSLLSSALLDNYFQANWSAAINRASRIFEYPARDEVGAIKLRPNLEWLVANVSKIMEGYYGHPTPKTKIPHYEKMSYSDKESVRKMIQDTKAQLEQKAWSVSVSFTTIKLRYLGETVKDYQLPPLKEDQDALRQTLQSEADRYNRKNYRPRTQKQDEQLKQDSPFESEAPTDDDPFGLLE